MVYITNHKIKERVRLNVMTAFWDMNPCSVTEVDQHFKGACYLHHQGDYSAWAMRT
jgi:hypothetical protein